MTILSAFCRGKALRIVRSKPISESRNGYESWRLLYREYMKAGRSRAYSLLTGILKFDFSGDFVDRFNAWELLVQKYGGLVGVRNVVQDTIKASVPRLSVLKMI